MKTADRVINVPGYHVLAEYVGRAVLAKHFDKNAPSPFGVWSIGNQQDIYSGTYYKTLEEAELEFISRAFSSFDTSIITGKEISDGERIKEEERERDKEFWGMMTKSCEANTPNSEFSQIDKKSYLTGPSAPCSDQEKPLSQYVQAVPDSQASLQYGPVSRETLGEVIRRIER